jgi:hypothetical protein
VTAVNIESTIKRTVVSTLDLWGRQWDGYKEYSHLGEIMTEGTSCINFFQMAENSIDVRKRKKITC